MITADDLYTFLAQSGARVTKYPDSFKPGGPGALITIEGYVHLPDVVARINRAVEKVKPVFTPTHDLQRELLAKQIQVQDVLLAKLAKPAQKKRKRTR